MENYFTDLDELILLCRDKQAKTLLQEAVACYRSGAFRSCIISTWNAIVFDYIHKLRELKIFNVDLAIKELEHFEELNNNCDYRGLWDFEKKIPIHAKDKYEFISPIEKIDLDRLFDDRSRCAHPSVKSLEEPFEATAELARYHLRTSVIHFLQHPPVQGRKAFEQVRQIIKSLYFPNELDKAIKVLQDSPLAKPRFGLVKDIVLDITLYLLKEDIEIEAQKRLFCALNAIYEIHKLNVSEILDNHLSKIIINSIPDNSLHKVITYLSNVSGWGKLSYPCLLRLNSFIENISFNDFKDNNISILVEASQIDVVRINVIENLKKNITGLKDILTICKIYKNKTFYEKVASILIQDFLASGTINQLIEIKTYVNEDLKFLIDETITLKLKDSELPEFIKIILKKSKELPTDIYLSLLKEKIGEINITNLDQLISIKEYYDFDEDNQEIIELLEQQIQKILKDTNFNELIKYCSFWSRIPEHLLKDFLKENISSIVNQFIKSRSFAEASNNSDFLLKIIEFLTSEQWITIFNAFISNDQILHSYNCVTNFSIIFKRCIELNIVEQTNWIKLQEYLNKKEHCYDELEKLKKLINSYYGDN